MNGTPPPTRMQAEVERLRTIAEKQAQFIEGIAAAAPGRLGQEARDLLVQLGAWVETVQDGPLEDPLVPKLRAFAQRREDAGHEDAAREINEIADALERR